VCLCVCVLFFSIIGKLRNVECVAKLLAVGGVQFDCSGSVLDEVPFKMYEAFLFYLQGLGYGMQTNFFVRDNADI